jgi:hypothetical protein
LLYYGSRRVNILEPVFEWKICNCLRSTDDGFVYSIHFSVTSVYYSLVYTFNSSVTLDRPDTLIPFDELDEKLMIGWVKDKLGESGVVNIQNTIVDRLKNLEEPDFVSGLPWVN